MSRRPPIPSSRSLINSSTLKNLQDVAKLIQDGLALHNAGRINDARLCYLGILKKQANHFDALQLLAITYTQQKHPELALQYFDKALLINKANPAVFNNKGAALEELKRFNEALECYDRALRIKPDFVEALNNKGNVLHELGRFDEALQCCEQVLLINPDFAGAWNNKGNTLNELKRFDEAFKSCEQALRINPDFAESWNNLGNALNGLNQFDEALQSYDQALYIKPDYVEVLNNKGSALNGLKRLDDALESYDQALRMKPDYVEALNNKGNLLSDLKRFDEALQSYSQALSINPNYAFLMGNMQHARMHTCNWSDFHKNVDDLRLSVNSNLPSSAPFPMLGLIDDPEIQKKCATTYMNFQHPNRGRPYVRDLKSRVENLKIGYYSADFYDHATLHLMLEVFKNHNHSRFDFFAFSFGPKTNDPWQQEVKNYFKEFIDITKQSDVQVADFSRKLGIDIAIDLKGFTQDSRPGIFANRAAPIQINYLGYPGTMGADYIDYIIADKVIVPEESQKFYSEEVLYLPYCYQPNIHIRKVSEKAILRKDVGLRENVTVYCSFNNIYKITPDIFSLWLGILSRVADSVLWILSTNKAVENKLIQFAKDQGIESARIIFAPHLPIEEHLKRLSLADVFLDTYPYNAHTTASDSVRMGVPIVTLAGQSFASRVAASILSAVNMTDLITNNADDYQNLAVRLGTDRDYLKKTKDRLLQSIPQSPLFDSVGFTKDLEQIYLSLVNS